MPDASDKTDTDTALNYEKSRILEIRHTLPVRIAGLVTVYLLLMLILPATSLAMMFLGFFACFTAIYGIHTFPRWLIISSRLDISFHDP